MVNGTSLPMYSFGRNYTVYLNFPYKRIRVSGLKCILSSFIHVFRSLMISGGKGFLYLGDWGFVDFPILNVIDVKLKSVLSLFLECLGVI